MPRALPPRPCLATAVLCALLAGCAPAPPDAAPLAPVAPTAEQGTEQLTGTWLREAEADGLQARRLLVLAADGSFHESVRVVDGAGRATEFAHEGTWLFDGTNLKRKYTLMNGRPPSRLNVPFATFEIRFDARNAFTGIDHIHRHEIHYRRVAPDTAL